jgi:hypothetical protein
LSDAVQVITSIAAVILGIGYVVGGLIVNIHLSAYGVTEYQVVRVKYLVVGLIYLANFITLLLATGMISVALMSVIIISSAAGGESVYNYFYVLFAISFISALSLVFIWIFDKTISKRKWLFLKSWWTYVVLSILSLMFPLSLISIQVGAISAINPLFPAMLIIVVFLGALGQIYFYSRNLYGNPSLEGFDPIGMGIPVKVRLAGEESAITLLNQMGIEIASPNTSSDVYLIDETDSHYIVSPKLQIGVRIYKVEKSMIKGLIYLEA